MILISAMSQDRVIGSGAGMPWTVPAEYAQFLEFVRGQTVVMGRRSWEIFGPDLTSAHNVVVSRSLTVLDGAEVAPTLERGLERARSFGGELFVAGGGQIYRQALPLADAMYLSIIEGEYSGDTYFPEFDESDWRIVERRHEPGFEFRVYRRR